MDHKEMVAYLKSHKELMEDIEFLENKMIGLKGISYSNEGGTSVQVNNPMFKLLAEKDEKIKQAKSIEMFIASNLTGFKRTVIYDKFIFNQSLEEISSEIGYSLSHTKRLYKTAIKDLCEKMIPNEPK